MGASNKLANPRRYLRLVQNLVQREIPPLLKLKNPCFTRIYGRDERIRTSDPHTPSRFFWGFMVQRNCSDNS